MPKAFSEEFKRDVLDVARKREVPLKQIAADFNISVTCLERWLRAERDSKLSPGDSPGVLAEMKELKKRNRLLEQELEVFRRAQAYLSVDLINSKKGFTR